MKPVLPIALLLAVLSSVSWAQEFTWPEAGAAEMGIDPQAIAALDQRILQGDFGRIKSLLVLRHGRLVHERYFNGYTANDQMPVFSVTKSWASALMGIAIREGDLAGVDVPLQDIFADIPEPFAASARKRRMTVHDLLTQRHGLAWDEWSTFFSDPVNPVNQMVQTDDWWRFVLERPSTAPPDSVFRYSTGVSNLMGGILFRQTGLTAIEYADATLHAVLDINDYHIEVNMDDGPRGSGITQFQSGLSPTGAGMWFRARDLAKIGQLYLDDGVWQSQRVISRNWVADSFGRYSDHVSDPEVFSDGVSYGYQWWTLHLDELDGGPVVHLANGFAGQYIYVIPELDMVVVSTADNGGRSGPTITTGLRETLLPSVEADFDPASDGGLTGSWYSRELDSQGFMLEVVPSTGLVVIYWMTFDPQSDEQMWLAAVGELHGRRAVLQFLRPEGGSLEGGAPATLQAWGDVELLFTDCTHATLTFFSEVAGVSGVMNLERLTPNLSCTDD